MSEIHQSIISASILSADLARLGEDVVKVLKAGADWIHFDVMDQHYVKNFTFGPSLCQALRRYGITAPIDVHLMTQPVDDLIRHFAKSGATYITFHAEASEHPEKSLDLIHELGCKAGLAVNPDQPLSEIDPYFAKLDLVLLMTVYPGLAGQGFISEVRPKIVQARQKIDASGSKAWLSVDGGINAQTIADVAQDGANVFVVGSAIFKSSDYREAIKALRYSANA